MSVDQALVSVIVPTHKRLTFLKQTVGSILTQSYRALELIIVADGHDQDVADFVSELRDLRAKYLACPHAGRPAIPRNLGIRNARGKYIALCDDDDLWHGDKLKKQLAPMQQDGLDFTFTTCFSIDQNGNRIGKHLLGEFPRVGKSRFLLSLGGMIYNCSIVVSQPLLKKAGLFNEDASLRSAEDYELCSRLLIYSDGVGICEPLVSYRTHIQSIQPRTIIDWLRVQARIQSAILANGSAPIWLWLGRYLRVLYWASRVHMRQVLTRRSLLPH